MSEKEIHFDIRLKDSVDGPFSIHVVEQGDFYIIDGLGTTSLKLPTDHQALGEIAEVIHLLINRGDDVRDDDDYPVARLEDDNCHTCGGQGFAEYLDCPEAWGEGCPSEKNHLITCPNCGGSGNSKDCSVW